MWSSKRGDDPRRVGTAFARYLRSGVRSTSEALAYLRRRGVSSSRAALLLADARRRGALDDRACARLWAEQWARRGWADAAIRAKLSAKGLPARAIEGAMTRMARAGEREAARAQQVAAASRARQPGPLARALALRGFEPDVIDRLLEESFGPRPSHDE